MKFIPVPFLCKLVLQFTTEIKTMEMKTLEQFIPVPSVKVDKESTSPPFPTDFNLRKHRGGVIAKLH